MNARRDKRRGGRTTAPGSGTSDSVGLRAPVGNSSGGNGRQILFYSNAPWAKTGYGTQTAQLTKRLIKAGHSTAIHANYGLEGSNTNWQGIEIYPKGMSPYSDDVTVAHYQEWAHRRPDLKPLLLTLFDVWVFQSKAFDLVPSIVSWVPIDHTPCPPDVVAWCQRPNVLAVAMSKFGEKMLHNAGVDAVYAPHGIEKEIRPTPTFGGLTGRQVMGVPEDAFLVMINAANKGNNPPRKAWGENLLAFGMFAKTHPDAWLYVHSDIQGAQGVNLRSLADAAGIPSDRIVFADQYVMRTGVDPECLSALYSAADVLLACSMGEGFGIPVVEAQACGTPVITTNQTAQLELNGSGWLVDCQPYWDHSQRSWFHMPYVREIIAGLEEAYKGSVDASDAAITFAKQYEADHVFRTYWEPILAVAP